MIRNPANSIFEFFINRFKAAGSLISLWKFKLTASDQNAKPL